MILRSRDEELLEALTHHVRVLTLPQIARTWWANFPNPIRTARARLRALESEDLVILQQALAHPELDFDAPVFSWEPPFPSPDAGAISYRLQSRWSAHPITTCCIAASRAAANRFHGHGGRFPRAVERSHDINLSRVYLIYRERGALPGWTFEEELRGNRRHRTEPLPDVVIDIGESRRIVEFGGAYPKAKLDRFHAYCKEHSFPYEIW